MALGLVEDFRPTSVDVKQKYIFRVKDKQTNTQQKQQQKITMNKNVLDDQIGFHNKSYKIN